MNRSILIISYFFPPINAVASHRCGKLAKYLEKYGWDVYVIAARPLGHNESLKVEMKADRVTYIDYKEANNFWHKRKVLYFFYRAFRKLKLIPRSQDKLWWIEKGYEEAKKVTLQNNIDLVFSSAGPWSCHLIARKIKREYGTPWIADYRDLMSSNSFSQNGFYREFLMRLYEKRLISIADGITVVSKPMNEVMENIYKGSGKITTIPNGYDEASYKKDIQNPLEFEGLSILYTGNLYNGQQLPHQLFRILHKLDQENRIAIGDVLCFFAGNQKTKKLINDFADDMQVSKYVKHLGFLDYDQNIDYQKSADCLLYPKSHGPRSVGIYSGKIFEYLGAGRPILLTDGDRKTVIDDLIEELDAGFIAKSDKQLADYLLESIRQKRRVGHIPFHPIDAKHYTREYQAQQFEILFEEIVKKQTGEHCKNLGC